MLMILCHLRNAGKEEHDHLRVLSGALRGCDLHDTDQKKDPLLLLQSDRALRAHLFHGPSRVHAATRFRREVDPW